jgi:hypothetical protein
MGIPVGAFTQASLQGLLLALGSQFSTSAAGGGQVMPVNTLTGANVVFFQVTAGGGGAFTTRSAAQLLQDLTTQFGFVPPIGYSWYFEMQNVTGSGFSLAAGAGVTLSGSGTVAGGTNRAWICTITNNSSSPAITIQEVATRTF